MTPLTKNQQTQPKKIFECRLEDPFEPLNNSLMQLAEEP